MVNEQQLNHPSVQRLVRIARALGDLVDSVVFIGGSIAPLLQGDPPFDETRVTKDVDGVVASTRYSDIEPLHEVLRARGFKQSPDGRHVHRWLSPERDELDLVPSGEHPGGSGQVWDKLALAGRVSTRLAADVIVWHASGPAFIALKWAAFRDRGAEDPLGSRDLEDILALVASREELVGEIAACDLELKLFIVDRTSELLESADLSDLLAAHLNNAQDPRLTALRVRERLEQIAAL